MGAQLSNVVHEAQEGEGNGQRWLARKRSQSASERGKEKVMGSTRGINRRFHRHISLMSIWAALFGRVRSEFMRINRAVSAQL